MLAGCKFHYFCGVLFIRLVAMFLIFSFAEHSGASVHKHIAELDNDKDMLQHAVDHGIKDYDLLVMGNKNLSSECNELKIHCKGLQAELAKACFDTQKGIADLEAKFRFDEACSINVAADGEKCLR
jgi:hypothetical protein